MEEQIHRAALIRSGDLSSRRPRSPACALPCTMPSCQSSGISPPQGDADMPPLLAGEDLGADQPHRIGMRIGL